jgi:hypothetical protein
MSCLHRLPARDSEGTAIAVANMSSRLRTGGFEFPSLDHLDTDNTLTLLRCPIPPFDATDAATDFLSTPHQQTRRTTLLNIRREEGQSIVINGQIVVTVVEIRGDNIRLAIETLPSSTSDAVRDVRTIEQREQTRKRPR